MAKASKRNPYEWKAYQHGSRTNSLWKVGLYNSKSGKWTKKANDASFPYQRQAVLHAERLNMTPEQQKEVDRLVLEQWKAMQTETPKTSNPSPKYFYLAGREDKSAGRVLTPEQFASTHAHAIAGSGGLTFDQMYRHYEDGAGLGMREYSRNPGNPYDWYDLGWTSGRQDWDAKNAGLDVGDPYQVAPQKFKFLFDRAVAYEPMTPAKATIAKEDFLRGYNHGVDGRPKGKNKGIPKGARRVKSNPMARPKANPESSAIAMYETFHGAAPTKVTEYVEEHRYHSWLPQLGDLQELKVALIYAKPMAEATITFGGDDVHLACNEAGNQLYFVGGDQSLDLKALKLSGAWERDSMVIGVLTEVTYRTKKKFDKFKLTDYYHHVGEDTKDQPMLIYDRMNNTLAVAGGKYIIEWRGIVN